jgi:FkbM family methyltransferase
VGNKLKLYFWIPIPRLSPLKTFPHRTIYKWIWIIKYAVGRIGALFNFSGAKVVGTTISGNTMMQLNKSNALGRKGSIIEIPRDEVIFNKIRFDGTYDLEESKFISKGLKKACSVPKAKVALIDIGANIGLVTLQAMNLAKSDNEVFCFEPIPQHVTALRNNLSELSKKVRVNIQEFGLSDKNGTATIFTEKTNRGNSSLLQSVVPENGRTQSEIRLVDTKTHFENNFMGFTSFVIKCDTQGMDALILSRIPNLIWENTICAEIEVWALPSILTEDVDTLLCALNKFDLKSWSPNEIQEADIEEIRAYWLGKSGTWRNLYLSKSN